MNTKLYLISKFFHRILVIIITVIGIIIGSTGIVLKFPDVFINKVDLGLVRLIHNDISLLFSISFFIMTISGIIMYIFPLTRKK